MQTEDKRIHCVGVIAEFNPFHNGHALLLREARRMTGADYVIVVMSGDFVQRGEPAVCDKYIRTEMALRGGADAVFELPVTYAAGDAGRFAEGAVSLLAGLGCVDSICFGSECGDIDALWRIARVLADEPKEFGEKLRSLTRQGLSYPAARTQALEGYLGAQVTEGITDKPNNLLAIEYLKALTLLQKGAAHIMPVTVKRVGAGYNDASSGNELYPSASGIRGLIARGEPSEMAGMPKFCSETLSAGMGKVLPITSDDLSDMLFYRLNTMSREELRLTEGMTDDLADRIWKYREEPVLFTELAAKVKTKNVTYSAVSRALLHIVLGSRKIARPQESTQESAPKTRQQRISEVRLLGFRREASAALRYIADAGVRVVTKPADADRADTIFMQDTAAADIYGQLVFSKFGTRPVGEMRRGPVII